MNVTRHTVGCAVCERPPELALTVGELIIAGACSATHLAPMMRATRHLGGQRVVKAMRELLSDEKHTHVWVEAGPPDAPYQVCDECGERP